MDDLDEGLQWQKIEDVLMKWLQMMLTSFVAFVFTKFSMNHLRKKDMIKRMLS
ncbi:MAG: hypothetical protein Ta2E_12350 [Mycoplasmoidaceae bacterium]|nr:MAG: hypothetical protein Ta2E_12350 [Mycoplasmoidaceae bacterium]